MKQSNIIALLFVTGAIVLGQPANAQLTNFGNLYIHAGAALSVSGSVTNSGTATDFYNSGTVQLDGDFTNNGNDLNAAGTGTVIFKGVTPQFINGTQATGFYNLTQTNPGIVTITRDQLIRNNLVLTAGEFSLGSNTLTINGGINYSSGRLSSTEYSSLVLNDAIAKILNFSPTSTQIKSLTVNASALNVTLADSLKIAGSTLGVLTVNGLLNTNGLLTVGSDAAGTARVAPSYGTIVGKVTVERYIPAQRSWRLLTSPLTNTSSIYNEWQNAGVYAPGRDMLVTGPAPSATNGLDASPLNNFSMKWWDVNTQALIGVGDTKNNSLSNNNGSADNKGYFVFVRGDRNPVNTSVSYNNITTLSSRGNLQLGTQVFAASNTAGKYTLIGNPYASPVDFNSLNRQNLVKRFYVWDPSLNEVGGYVMLDDLDGNNVFTKTVNASSQDNNIQSGQAFFVETIAASPASITFNEPDKSAVNNGAVFRPVGISNGSIRASLFIVNADTSEKLADETFAEFNENYNTAVNYQDALKFGNVNENFSFIRNGVALCAERRPLITADDTLFFRFTKSRQLNYSMHIQYDNINNSSMQAYLEDSYTATLTPVAMNDVSHYNFTVNGDPVSSASNRFRIVFKQLSVLPVTFVEIKGYKANSNNKIDWTVENGNGIATYTIERSLDGRQFKAAGSMPSTGAHSYSWEDMQTPASDCFYRVAGNNINGEKTYSKIVKIAAEKTPGITVFPNPVTENKFYIKGLSAGKHSLSIINSSGQTIYKKEINNVQDNPNVLVQLPVKIATGNYKLVVTSSGSIIVNTALNFF